MPVEETSPSEGHRSGKARYVAVLEVILVLSGTIAVVGLVANSEWAGRQLAELGKPFLEYLALMSVPLALLVVTRRSLQEHGVSAHRVRENVRGAFVCMVPYAAAHVLLLMVSGRPALAAAVSGGLAMGVLMISARLLPSLEPAPLVLCTALPVLILSHDAIVEAILAAGFHILFLGPGEEILFRGYIQSRLNGAFGRPWSHRGVEFGWGLPITAALFGVFHVLNLPQLYAGQVDLQWGAGVATAAWGLFFGYLREWSGSVVAPALVHGVPQGIASAVLG
jgi:uncharacterized protein